MSAPPPGEGDEVPQSPEPDETQSYPEDEAELRPYAGRWVARLGGRIVGQGGTPDQALRSAKASRFREQPEVTYVPIYPQVPFQDILDEILSVVPQELSIYLVGGAVRDLLSKKEVHDLDFALPVASLEIARRVANRLRAAYFPLDKERETGRVIHTDSQGRKLVLDFALFRGDELEDDLRARDFTINSMALDLRHSLALMDPLGGASDLHSKLLKACAATSLEDDPVRVLRAIRLASAYGLHIQPETRRQMRQAADLLERVAPERRRDELFRILEGPQPATCLRALEIINSLPGILPEILTLRGVDQSPPHIYDAWTHTLEVIARLETVLSVFSEVYYPESASNLYAGELSLRIGRYRQQVTEYLNAELSEGRSVRGLLFFAALYHDVAKPLTQQSEPYGRIRFFGHDQVGAEMVSHRASELRLSKPEIDWLTTVVSNHMRPILLSKLENGLSRKAIYRFFRATGDSGVGVCLLSLADTWGTYGPGLPPEIWREQVDTVRALLEAWYENPQESVRPPSWVNGHDLMTLFGLESGPQLGELLEKIREAQATGLVQSREQALDYVRDLLENQRSNSEAD